MKNLFKLFVLFFSLQASAQYCTPTYAPNPIGGCQQGDNIYKVVLGDIDLTTYGCSAGGYQAFSNTTDLVAGNSYMATISTGNSANENVRIYIDWNNDFDFDDVDEVFGGGPSTNFPYEDVLILITVPANASLGSKRIRVVIRYAGLPTPCETGSVYGETEDYNAVVIPPPPGEALDFELGNSVEIPSSGISTSFTNSPEITVEAWVYTSSIASGIDNPIVESPGQFVLGQNSASTFYFTIEDNTSTYTVVGGTVLENQWQHIVGVYDYNHDLKIYLNGVLQNTNNFFGVQLNSASGPTKIGGLFNGKIDELRLWNQGKSYCDLFLYRNIEIPTSANGLIANYHFNQGLGDDLNVSVDTLIDASGNSNTGNLIGFTLNGNQSNWIIGSPITNGDTIVSNIPPTLTSIFPPAITYCLGDQLNFTAVGTDYDTLYWNNGITNSVDFTPIDSSYYTVVLKDTLSTCSVQTSIYVSSSPSAEISTTGNGIFSSNSAVSYQWINCATNTAIAGETNETFTPISNGSYAVLTTNIDGCVDTSECVTISNVGIDEQKNVSFSMAPNPSADFVTFTFTGETATVTIVDINGKLVKTIELNSNETIDIRAFEKGIYFVNCNNQTQQLIKL